MKLPTIKTISKEDLKDAPDWILGVINPINSFMESVYTTLNKNVTLAENVTSFLREVNYITPSTYPTGVTQVTFKNTLKTRAVGVMVMQAYDKETYEPAAGPVYAPWIENNGTIELGTVTGLAASKTYVIRFVVF